MSDDGAKTTTLCIPGIKINEKGYQMFHVKPDYRFVAQPVNELGKKIGLDPAFSKQSIDFLQLLLDYNQKVNLVSRKDESNIVVNQWLHSIICFPLFQKQEPVHVLDIGSGGGFPGILLALRFRQTHFVLVESIAKKCRFLEIAAKEFHLNNVEIVNKRVEKLSAKYHSRFDVVVARAVTNIKQLYVWSYPLLKSNGFLLTWKKFNSPEIDDLKNNIKLIDKIDVLTIEKDFGFERLKETRLVKVSKM